MFRIVNKLERVLLPQVKAGHIFFIDDGNVVSIEPLTYSKKYLFKIEQHKMYNLKFIDNHIFSLSNGILYIYDFLNKDVSEMDIGFTHLISLTAKRLIGTRKVDGKRVVSVLNLESNHIEYSISTGLGNVLCSEQYIVHESFLNEALITNYSLFNGDLVSEIQLSSINEIPYTEPRFSSASIIYKDCIIKSIPEGILASFDVFTGELQWYVEGVSLLVSEYKGKIYNLNTDTFVIIDASTGKIEKEISMLDQYRINKIEMASTNTLCVTDTHVFFTDNWKSKIGALNIEKCKLDWVYQLDTKQGTTLPNAPIIEEKRMYILDSAGTLHILEKATTAKPSM